ncbi:peptidoglycan-binding domain-containing protein [Novispirillum sp. DQ9]|uniref:peptidoglycan-binding domain-containing protein n=1 Tax=Novispirillum sp. DQ9 TaxID=3398612 RepID=UPI003C7EA73F
MRPAIPILAAGLLLGGTAVAQDYSPGGFGPSGLERYGLRHGDVTAATGGTTGVDARAPQLGSAVPTLGAEPGGGAALVGRLTTHPQTVRRVQQALIKEGHAVEVDGILGPQTQQALRLYQERHGLVPDGLLDQQTLRALGGASPLVGMPPD